MDSEARRLLKKEVSQTVPEAPPPKKKISAWVEHVKAVHKAHPGMTLGDAMKLAKTSYKAK